MSGLCPHHGKALQPRRVAGNRQIESCLQCQGLWLVPATTASLVGHALNPAALAALPASRPFASLPCPVDGSGMRALHSHGVEIDLCARCSGVWLDAGELEQLLALKQTVADDRGESVDDAIELALEFGDGLFGHGDTGLMPARSSLGSSGSDTGLSLADVEPAIDSQMLLVQRADVGQVMDSKSGILDSAGEAIGAVFEFVGDALSGL